MASELGREYDMVIGGKRLRTAGKIVFARIRRGRRRWSACISGLAPSMPQKAMQAAQAAFVSWSRAPVEERAELLFNAAEHDPRAEV